VSKALRQILRVKSFISDALCKVLCVNEGDLKQVSEMQFAQKTQF
jgi:hypothetical protein